MKKNDRTAAAAAECKQPAIIPAGDLRFGKAVFKLCLSAHIFIIVPPELQGNLPLPAAKC